jgi:hypothetical protein
MRHNPAAGAVVIMAHEPSRKNPRHSGRLAGRVRSANRIPAILPWSAPNITGQSLRAKFHFPGGPMEAVGPKQRPRQFSVRKLSKTAWISQVRLSP